MRKIIIKKSNSNVYSDLYSHDSCSPSPPNSRIASLNIPLDCQLLHAFKRVGIIYNFLSCVFLKTDFKQYYVLY